MFRRLFDRARSRWIAIRGLSRASILAAARRTLARFAASLVRTLPALGIVAISAFLYVSFGLHHLSQFQTADEDLWVASPETGRLQDFWKAIDAGDALGTKVNDKPGATMMLIAGYFGRQHDSDPDKKMLHGNKVVRQYGPEMNERTLYHYRLPILLVNGALILAMFVFLAVALESSLIAASAVSFIFLSPILLGLSQIINPDATLWSFFAASLFAYLAFLKRGQWRYLPFAGIFGGLALASKYSATLLIVFLFCATFFALFFHRDSFPERKAFARYTRRTLLGYAAFVALSIWVFTEAFPAASVDHELIYKGTIAFKGAADTIPILIVLGGVYGAALLDAIVFRSFALGFLFRILRHTRLPIVTLFAWTVAATLLFTLFNWSYHNVFEFSDVPFDLGRDKEFTRLPDLDKVLLGIKPLVFTLTPIALGFALLALLFPGTRSTHRSFVIGTLAAFIVAFYTAVFLQGLLVHVRYSNVLYPVIAVLAALGISGVGSLIIERYRVPVTAAIVVVALGASALVLLGSRPFYFNYTNQFLPRDLIVTGAWGYGGYEAAQVLHSLPDSDKLAVWADYDGFCPFFRGQCIEGSSIKWYKGGDFTKPDYAVVSRRGLMRNKSTWKTMTENGIVDERNPEWELLIGDRPGNFVRIYRIDKNAKMPPKPDDAGATASDQESAAGAEG